MGFVKEFREFALRGNVFDMAIGVIIGAAFGTIVNSVINDLLMPLIGMAWKSDFTNLYIALSDTIKPNADGTMPPLVEARKMGAVFAYGSFITVVLNFLILAFCVFLMVKVFNTARKRFEREQPPAAPPGPTKDQQLLTEIRDLLRQRA